MTERIELLKKILNKKSEREATAINVHPKVWHNFKLHCVNEKTSMSDKLEELIIKELEREV